MREVVTRRTLDEVRFRHGVDFSRTIPPDSYKTRLIKYIPSETIVLYIALYGILYSVMGTDPAFGIPARWLLIAGVVCTPLYLWKAGQVSDWVQLLISAIAFLLWAAALGVIPVSEIPGYNQVAASVLLPVYTFGIPLIDCIPEIAQGGTPPPVTR